MFQRNRVPEGNNVPKGNGVLEMESMAKLPSFTLQVCTWSAHQAKTISIWHTGRFIPHFIINTPLPYPTTVPQYPYFFLSFSPKLINFVPDLFIIMSIKVITIYVLCRFVF